MNIFGLDAIIGDFQLSNYGLILSSFENTDSSDEELGMNHDTIEEYIGQKPVPVYLGSSFHSKLQPTAKVLSPPCIGLVFVTNLVSIKLIMVYGEYGECSFR